MKKPQISSGFEVNSIGPGRSPCRVTATSRMAEVAPPGIPSVSAGIRLVGMQELFDASGAMIPSGAPLPNRSGCFEDRCATL